MHVCIHGIGVCVYGIAQLTNTHFKIFLPRQNQKKGMWRNFVQGGSKISPNTCNLTSFHSTLKSRNNIPKTLPLSGKINATSYYQYVTKYFCTSSN